MEELMMRLTRRRFIQAAAAVGIAPSFSLASPKPQIGIDTGSGDISVFNEYRRQAEASDAAAWRLSRSMRVATISSVLSTLHGLRVVLRGHAINSDYTSAGLAEMDVSFDLAREEAECALVALLEQQKRGHFHVSLLMGGDQSRLESALVSLPVRSAIAWEKPY